MTRQAFYAHVLQINKTAHEFFVPLHASYLLEWCPSVLPFLGLAPGWRILTTDGYEDV